MTCIVLSLKTGRYLTVRQDNLLWVVRSVWLFFPFCERLLTKNRRFFSGLTIQEVLLCKINGLSLYREQVKKVPFFSPSQGHDKEILSMKLPEYRSIEEKKPMFGHVKIDDKKTLTDHLDHLLADNSHCIFRGVREARYKLFTSVQREWITNGLGRPTINDLVGSLLSNIRKNTVLNKYFQSLNVVQTDFLYLSLLQHYSAPTPLLDFTHDYQVALYFATANIATAYTANDIDDYFSLYYIDLDKVGTELVRMDDFLNRGLELGKELVEELGNRYPIDKSPLDSLDQYMKWKDNLYVVPLAFVDNPKFARAVTTPYTGQTLYWSNLNITAQKGCFLLYNREDIPLEEHLDNSMVWCLDIHKSLVYAVQKNYLSGITHDTLFPSITQMAQEAYTRFRERL